MNHEWCPIAKRYEPLRAGSIDGTDLEPHDRAVWRAMFCRYRPNKGVQGDPLLTLFVSRLNPQTTEDKLREVFSKYGDVGRLRLVRDIVTGFSKGYAFVEYKEERSLTRARRDANRLVVDQHELFVDFEQERTLKGWVPRRLGGGQGGKKESGQLRFGGKDRPFRRPINLGFASAQEWPAGGGGAGRDWDRGGGGGGHRERERAASSPPPPPGGGGGHRERDRASSPPPPGGGGGHRSGGRETERGGSRGRREGGERERERGREVPRERTRDRSGEREDRRHGDKQHRHRDRR